MNYKLINKLTGEEHICQKMVVDGWDYYVSDEIIEEGWKGTAYKKDVKGQIFKHFYTTNDWYKDAKKVIATNNPNIDDIPKVVDEVERLGEDETNIRILKHKTPSQIARQYFDGFIEGYNKSQETHPFSEEDMIEFLEWVIFNYPNQWKSVRTLNTKGFYSTKELLQLWREQKTKTIWYE